MNTAAILRGPAIIQWRGATIYHRGNIEVPMEHSTFDIDVEPFGVVQSRSDAVSIPINVTPAGRVTEVTNLINRYSTTQNGALINIEEYPVTVDATANTLTATQDTLVVNGDEVMVHALITMPGGLVRTTRYYARRGTGNAITLHTSEAGAIANTGVVDITTVGSAVVLDVTRALTITTFAGLQIKYWNVGLVGIPDLIFGSTETMLGQCEFRAFVRNGQDPASTTDRFYTLSAATPTDTSFATDQIVTASPLLTWGSAPWVFLPTREAVTVAFDLSTESLPSDAYGDDALGMIFGDLNLTVTARPQGITESEVKAALELQAGALRGGSPTPIELAIQTDSTNFTIAAAILQSGGLMFGSAEQRVGELTWKSQKTFTAGVKDPIYDLEFV